MNKIERRKFLKVAGVGVAGVAASAAAGPLASLVISMTKDGILHLRAVTGLPKAPLPAYASYVLDGRVDLIAKSGVVHSRLFAGAPGAMSTIVFPGTERLVRVTDVQQSNGSITISGVVERPSQLGNGEDPNVAIVVNRSQGLAWARFFGTDVSMRLEDAVP